MMKESRAIQMKKVPSKGPQTREPAGEGGLWELCLFTVLFVLVFSAIARADAGAAKTPAANVTAALNKPELVKPDFAYSARLSISTAQSLSEDHPQDYSGYYSLDLGATHKPSKIGLSAKAAFSQEYSYQRADGTDHNWVNPSVSLSKGFKNGEEFNTILIDSLKISLAGSLPANRDSQKRTFRGSLGSSVSVVKALGMVDIAQGFGYTRGFYEYDIREDGGVNSPDVFKTLTSLTLNLTDKLSLGLAFDYSYAISYQGVGRGSQMTDLSAGYQYNKHVGFGVGLSTLRGTISPDGQSDQIRFYDPDASQVYFDVSIGI